MLAAVEAVVICGFGKGGDKTKRLGENEGRRVGTRQKDWEKTRGAAACADTLGNQVNWEVTEKPIASMTDRLREWAFSGIKYGVRWGTLKFGSSSTRAVFPNNRQSRGKRDTAG